MSLLNVTDPRVNSCKACLPSTVQQGQGSIYGLLTSTMLVLTPGDWSIHVGRVISQVYL